MSETPLVDAAVLDDLIEYIGEEPALAIIELFLGECRELVAAISGALGDSNAPRRAAHSLKSSAGQLGAAALAEAALAVEVAPAAELPGLAAALADCAALTETALKLRVT